MQPRTLDSSTPIASANLLFSVLPEVEGFPAWEPAICTIGDVSYQTELKKLDGDAEKTVRYTITMREALNESLQQVTVTQAIRISYAPGSSDVQLSYKHNLASAQVCFNPSTMTESELTVRVFVALNKVVHGY
jgi:hypothetical protein